MIVVIGDTRRGSRAHRSRRERFGHTLVLRQKRPKTPPQISAVLFRFGGFIAEQPRQQAGEKTGNIAKEGMGNGGGKGEQTSVSDGTGEIEVAILLAYRALWPRALLFSATIGPSLTP